MTKATVYVIDDDIDVRQSLKSVLERDGFRVKTFDTAKRFLDDAFPVTSGCLLLDLHMPGMSGLELQKQLARQTPDLPILFLSRHGSVPEVVEALKFGAVDFLEKPLNHRILVSRIRKVIDQLTYKSQMHEKLLEIRTKVDTLSSRERQVVDFILEGLSSKQIALKFCLSEKTIANHRLHIMRKMNAVNVAELARMVTMVKTIAR